MKTNEDLQVLKGWGLKCIRIQNNVLIGAQRPTTQDDNFGQIFDRFDLYLIPSCLVNGILCDMRDGKETEYKCGHLVQYMNGEFAVLHGGLRYDFKKLDIIIE